MLLLPQRAPVVTSPPLLDSVPSGAEYFGESDGLVVGSTRMLALLAGSGDRVTFRELLGAVRVSLQSQGGQR